MYIRAYVCVMDVANLYLPYLMYLVSVRSRRLLPRAAAFRCLGGGMCTCTYLHVGIHV